MQKSEEKNTGFQHICVLRQNVLIFPGKRTLSVALNALSQFVLGPVYMRPGRSQGGAEIEICGTFT